MVGAYTKPVKEKLQETKDTVQEMAHDNLDKLHGRYNEVVDSLQTTYQDMSKKAGKALNKSMHTTQKKMGTAVSQLDKTVLINRWKVIVGALLGGLFLGYWLKRAS